MFRRRLLLDEDARPVPGTGLDSPKAENPCGLPGANNRHLLSSDVSVDNGPLEPSSRTKHIDGSSKRPYAALTVDVEDWFHSFNVLGKISTSDWAHCELRVEQNTTRMLEILAAKQVRATFFVLGWVADACPGLVRAIAAAGHEVASHGYHHEPVYALKPEEFRSDVLRSKQLLEDLTGQRVRGYRAPCFSITDWAIQILQECGFDYDSSAVPAIAHDRYGQLSGVKASEPITALRAGLTEACISCLRIGKRGLPWGGGGYFRLLPYAVWMRGINRIVSSGLPYIFYIHPWEIDPGQPDISGIGAANRFRQRVNLDRCEARFEALAGALDWVPLGELCDRWAPAAEGTTPQKWIH